LRIIPGKKTGDTLPSADQVEIRGKIVKALPNTTWEVEIPGGQTVLAYLGGRLRKNNIRIEPGDNVALEMSPYSLQLARITYRY
jgi:translation initiation factor IF-1